MQETQRLIDTLKRCLKAAGIKYSQVAKALQLSEASIKRIFSEGNFSLERMEKICEMMDMNISDLCRLNDKQQAELPRQLSLEQEAQLADQPLLLKYFYRLLNGWSPEAINEEQGLSQHQGTRLLAQLDRLGLIELQLGDQFKLKTGRKLAWRRDGPLWQRYAEAVQQDFLAPGFRMPGAALYFETGEVSTATLELLQRKLAKLAREFNESVELDASLQPANKSHLGLMIAIRPWLFSDLFGEEASAK